MLGWSLEGRKEKKKNGKEKRERKREKEKEKVKKRKRKKGTVGYVQNKKFSKINPLPFCLGD